VKKGVQKNIKKILWLVDPYEELKTIKPSALWVKALSDRLQVPIQPVHVLAGGAAGFAPEIHAAWLMQFVIDTEERLVSVLQALKMPRLLKPHVISEVYHSRSDAVQGLLDYARDNHAGLILLQRSGSKAKIGGFAETLLLKSETPVLVVPSEKPLQAKVKKLLVALDLSRPATERMGGVASEVFEQALVWARQLGASIHLFHVLPIPPAMAYGPGAFDLGATAAAAAYWSQDAAKMRRQELERFQKRALKAGVGCTVELETRPLRPEEAILRARSRSQADWIVMAGRSGRWSTLLLGSVTRSVARQAPCPVWIIHRSRLREQHLISHRQAA
jgi:nucleotide-binding universal stress UspA family protein